MLSYTMFFILCTLRYSIFAKFYWSIVSVKYLPKPTPSKVEVAIYVRMSSSDRTDA